jgi:hypothetical protein
MHGPSRPCIPRASPPIGGTCTETSAALCAPLRASITIRPIRLCQFLFAPSHFFFLPLRLASRCCPTEPHPHPEPQRRIAHTTHTHKSMEISERPPEPGCLMLGFAPQSAQRQPHLHLSSLDRTLPDWAERSAPIHPSPVAPHFAAPHRTDIHPVELPSCRVGPGRPHGSIRQLHSFRIHNVKTLFWGKAYHPPLVLLLTLSGFISGHCLFWTLSSWIYPFVVFLLQSCIKPPFTFSLSGMYRLSPNGWREDLMEWNGFNT